MDDVVAVHGTLMFVLFLFACDEHMVQKMGCTQLAFSAADEMI